jgi:uncharacterized protein (DUF433 family)
MGGEPLLRGTRIPLQQVVSLFPKGIREKEIAEDFPALSSGDLSAVLSPRREARMAAKETGVSARTECVMRLLLDENISEALVTTNAQNFIELLDVPVHPGLIVLRESGLSGRNSGSGSGRLSSM